MIPRKSAMLRILLSITSILAACTPSPQKAAMPGSDPVSGIAVQASSEASPQGSGSVAPGKIAPDPLADSPAAALGRRILSTAFVWVGPDGYLTVDLHDGRVLVLRHVVMRPRDYCGVQAAGDPARARYCGGYAEVAAARPGGGPAPAETDRAVSTPVEPRRGSAERY